jgi:hypothetical protein
MVVEFRVTGGVTQLVLTTRLANPAVAVSNTS